MSRVLIMLKLAAIMLYCCLPEAGAWQAGTLHDTLNAGEVLVTGRHLIKNSGFNIRKVETLLINDNSSLSLSDILKDGSPLFIKTYGPGGIATVSLRGAGASHTVVTWNGMNLNSPMLGQADFLQIPALAADEISIYNGGSSVAVVQGGLGGVVDIATRPEWNGTPSHKAMLMAGSFGRYSASYTGRYGNDKWRFSTRLNENYARNNFRYDNPYMTAETVRERRENASFHQQALIQEVWHREKSSVSALKLWLQKSYRDIPVAINISPASHRESMDSRTARLILSHDRYFQNDNSLATYAGLQYDNMIYRDSVTGLNSTAGFTSASLSVSWLVKTDAELQIKSSLMADMGFFRNSGYGNENKGISRRFYSLNMAADYRPLPVLGANVNGSVSFADAALIPPELSAGLEYLPEGDDKLVLKINIAARSRIPTLNDIYWVPGGNRNLRPERGYNSELSAGWRVPAGNNTMLQMHVSAYMNHIKNMIIWLPGTSGLWSPVNEVAISARGTEAGLSLTSLVARSTVSLMISHSYTRSVRQNDDKQLIYVPPHMGNAVLRAENNRFAGGASMNYTGKRFINSDNSRYLPECLTTDLWAGLKFVRRDNKFELRFRIENLFNTSYQMMAYHPMPTRSFTGSLIINTGKDNK